MALAQRQKVTHRMLDLNRHDMQTPLQRRSVLGLVSSLPLLTLPLTSAHAQFRVEVAGVGLTQLPVLVAPFKGEAQAGQNLSQIVQADLTRSGQFKPLSAANLTLDEMSRPDWSALRPLSAEALVAGSVTRLANGRYDVRARLWDAVKGQEKSDFKDNVTAADLRLSAHRVSDWVYQQMTGTPGVFTSRISYVTKSSGRYSLWIADSDGEGARSALSSPEPIISPSWSPNGTQLAYVSFESRKPVVYVHELATGQRRVVANFKGSNSAPAWAPDGRSIVATLSRDGGSQLFRIDLQGGEPRRLTQSGSTSSRSDRKKNERVTTLPVLARSLEAVADGDWRLSKLDATRLADLDLPGRGAERIAEIAARLRTHRAFALDGRVVQGIEARLDACTPSARIAKLRRAGSAHRMAGRALGFVDFFAGLHLAVGIADLHHADLLNALGSSLFYIHRACSRLVGRGHVIHQTNDHEDRNDKREKCRQQQLLGGFDGARVVFFVRSCLAVVAHGCPQINRGLSNCWQL